MKLWLQRKNVNEGINCFYNIHNNLKSVVLNTMT